MNFDLALLLVVLSALTGVIWLIDKLAFAPARRRRAESDRRYCRACPKRKERRACRKRCASP